jgi:mRNA interferase MazF
MKLLQYNIVLVNLDPTTSSEMKKTRPCVIISPNEMNAHLQTIVVAPITSKSKQYPTRILVTHASKKGWIILDQIRTIDRMRIVKIMGKLKPKEIINLKAILHETYVA